MCPLKEFEVYLPGGKQEEETGLTLSVGMVSELKRNEWMEHDESQDANGSLVIK
jgi:hypothetical protein